jgi:alkanesulfonate monooxygenase SsuD/methylene tetrahydromethanopterin reductase-like flavin-dependent oxidoreductase (luciferase family)
MRFGYLLHNNNHADWERHQTTDRTVPPTTPDATQIANDLRLMETAVGYGFNTVWTSEHHFSPYLMVPNTVQLLTYVAGRCPGVDVGTAVVVLPWHDPIRVAEELIMLDILLGGRKLFIGLGRGAGVEEFEGMRVPMGESRERFDEAVEIIKTALSQEVLEFSGQHFQIPRVSIRPRPLSTDLVDRLYNAWLSPGSLQLAAANGLAPLFAVERKPDEYVAERERYDGLRAEAGYKPVASKAVSFISVAESEQEAYEHMAYKLGYADDVKRHYGWGDTEKYKAIGGYDYYADRGQAMDSMDDATTLAALEAVSLYGTPDTVLQKIEALVAASGCDEIISPFNFGGMSWADGEKCLRLFSEKVLPIAQTFEGAREVAV